MEIRLRSLGIFCLAIALLIIIIFVAKTFIPAIVGLTVVLTSIRFFQYLKRRQQTNSDAAVFEAEIENLCRKQQLVKDCADFAGNQAVELCVRRSTYDVRAVLDNARITQTRLEVLKQLETKRIGDQTVIAAQKEEQRTSATTKMADKELTLASMEANKIRLNLKQETIKNIKNKRKELMDIIDSEAKKTANYKN